MVSVDVKHHAYLLTCVSCCPRPPAECRSAGVLLGSGLEGLVRVARDGGEARRAEAQPRPPGGASAQPEERDPGHPQAASRLSAHVCAAVHHLLHQRTRPPPHSRADGKLGRGKVGEGGGGAGRRRRRR